MTALFDPSASTIERIISANQAQGRRWSWRAGRLMPEPAPERGWSALELELLDSIQPALRAAWSGALQGGGPAHHLVACSACDRWRLSKAAPGQLEKAGRCHQCGATKASARVPVDWAPPTKRGRPVLDADVVREINGAGEGAAS